MVKLMIKTKMTCVSVPDFAAPDENMLKLRDLSILLRKKLTEFSKINKWRCNKNKEITIQAGKINIQ